jgi:protocatechuate 3,4-dioxygenase beta subunit
MAQLHRLRELDDAELVGNGDDPPYDFPAYRSTALRAPKRPLLLLPSSLSDRTGPVFGDDVVSEGDADLTRQHAGEPLGERINVSGRVLDRDGRPLRSTLLELWQANAAGRYRHANDRHPAPLDPNFSGAGRCLTDDEGRYRFTTVKPGAYPWKNHDNAWRPAHIHFSLFGRAFTERLITQMYFPGDPLFDADPILQSVRDPGARARLISSFDWDTTTPDWALGFRFDIILGGPDATPLED